MPHDRSIPCGHARETAEALHPLSLLVKGRSMVWASKNALKADKTQQYSMVLALQTPSPG